MRRACASVLCLFLLWACKKEPVAPAAPAGPARQAGTTEVDAGYVVEPAKLDGFIRYQKQLLPLYAELAREIDGLGRGDGGATLDAMGISAQVLGRRAEREQQVRGDCGLTERDVAELGEITRQVASRRASARLLATADQLSRLKRIDASRLKAEQQAILAKVIEELQAQQAETTDLSGLRSRFGSANVDRVLAREAELIKNWDEMMRAWGQR